MTSKGKEIQDQILAVLRQGSGHLSAYQIVGKLRGVYPKIAPPTVYRALAVLCERGQAHRVESANAYFACQCGGAHRTSILSICDDCGAVEESMDPELLSNLHSIVSKSGFAPNHSVIEVKGQCPACGGTKEVS